MSRLMQQGLRGTAPVSRAVFFYFGLVFIRYNLYTVYMTKTYTLEEFRKSTREAFNLVENGGTVVVTRYGTKFVIRMQEDVEAEGQGK